MTIDAVTSTSERERAIIRVGGAALITAAVGFMAVFSWLAARFNYPDVLDGRAADVLPALLAIGGAGRAVWAIYALLPLLWIPAAAGAFHALRASGEGSMRVASTFATVSAIALMLGLMRWPSFQWELARVWVADPGSHVALNAVFDAANSYLGNYIGEFLGELSYNLFFLLSGVVMTRKTSGVPKVAGWFGILTAVFGLIGMFRNVTSAVAPFAEVNNYLLPAWMIAFGVVLLRYSRSRAVAVLPAIEVA
jgi:hypothetical protein